MYMDNQEITGTEPIRILYVNGGILDLGGISSYMINYFRRIDKKVCHIDFAVHGDKEGVYDAEIKAAGSQIFHLPIKSRDYFGNVKALKKILREGNYDIIHSHLDAGSYHILKIAKKCGVPVRIAHSHNTDYLTKNKLQTVINEYYKRNIKKVSTHLMACSGLAGRWLFGENSEFTVIKNAIELEKFKFSSEDRAKIRNELGYTDDCIVLGHVGRFDTQKNHTFLMDVFSKLLSQNDKYRLVCIGDGHLRSEIESKAKELGIHDRIFFAGYTKNVEKYYSAFDMFVFPSLFEGLGIVAVEAQMSGLPCVLSDAVPEEAVVNTSALRIRLDAEEWVANIASIEIIDRNLNMQSFENAGYSIFSEAKKLEKIYLEISKGK